ncbi:MAG: Na(+)-translocating NADH-quinone reductase subunit C [Gammaproteobacteria bacterium]
MSDTKGNKDSVRNTLLVALAVSFTCAVLVSTTAVLLKPRQLENRLFYGGYRNIVQLLETSGLGLDAEDIMRELEVKLIDLATGAYIDNIDPTTFDQREALKDPEMSIAITLSDDLAKINRRAKYAEAYELRRGGRLHYVLLPINGAGMWSTIYGYIVLGADLNTVAGVSFHEHGETPGIGDKIQDPKWLAEWRGRVIYQDNKPAFEIVKRSTGAPTIYQVDAITGATITSESTGRMVRYWLGEHAFQPYLERLRREEANK